MLAQGRPQPFQLGYEPVQLPGHRPAASGGSRPLLLPVNPGREQLFLLGAQRRNGPGILPGGSGLLTPGAPARSPGPGLPGQAACSPSVRASSGAGPARRTAPERHRAARQEPARPAEKPHSSRPGPAICAAAAAGGQRATAGAEDIAASGATFRQPDRQGRDKAQARHSSAEGQRPGAARLSPNSSST